MGEIDILIVDDNLTWLALLTEIFQREGYSCMGAASIANMQSIIRVNHIRLIILDLHMEVGSGNFLRENPSRILRWISENSRYTKIIILSGAYDAIQQISNLGSGQISGYWSKGVAPVDEWVSRVFELLNNKHQID